MADETDTPETKADSKPAPRRRAPRKTTASAASEPKKTPRTRAKSAPKAASAEAAATPTPPSRTKRAAAPAKPRASKRTTPAPKKRAAPKSTIEKATDKVGGKWGAAAVVGGLAAAGAAAAALLSLRGSTPAKPEEPKAPEPPKLLEPATKAHQPDGTDASKSFQAGIADENTIPEA